MPNKFQKIVGAEVRNRQVILNSALKLFWDFQIELLSSKTNDEPEISGQEFLIPAYSKYQAHGQSCSLLKSTLQSCKHY